MIVNNIVIFFKYLGNDLVIIVNDKILLISILCKIMIFVILFKPKANIILILAIFEIFFLLV